MGKYCQYCGGPLEFEEVDFCPKCGVRLRTPPGNKYEISRTVLIVSYIVSAIIPIIGIPLCIYFLVKGKVLHFIGIAVVAIVFFFLWQGVFRLFV